MELTQIKYFLEAARTQHITKSAQRLHIAQPALSKAIHNLEQELGVPLFMRRGRNIRLTQYGEYLRDKLSPVMTAVDGIPDELSHMTEIESKTIRLAVSAASTLVTQAIIEYKRKNPLVNFHVIQNPDNELFDIEITTAPIYEKAVDESVFVCTEKIFIAVADNEKYDNIDCINLEQIKDEGFISLFGSKQLRSICDSFCQIAGFAPSIIFESDSPDAVKNMIAASIGIGFWPEFTWGSTNNSHIKLIEIVSPICKRDIIIKHKSIKKDTKITESFFQFLKEYFLSRKM